MAEDLVLAALRARLSDPAEIQRDPFGVMQQLCEAFNRHGPDPIANELILLAYEHHALFGDSIQILESLLRALGLFPYLSPAELSIADQIAYESYAVPELSGDVVFHRLQGEIFWQLFRGQSVVLSAPTSFGKSRIIDAVLAARKFGNVVIVVPTLALIDETRRRLAREFGDRYHIITHRSQAPRERNIFVFTQERLVEYPDLGKVDFFVVDEFYKLSPTKDDEASRVTLLNLALHKLLSQGTQFYMLGPNIDKIAPEFIAKYPCIFRLEKLTTVVTQVHPPVEGDESDEEKLIALCRRLGNRTVVYCRSPESARKVVRVLLDANISEHPLGQEQAAAWVASEYDAEWLFGKGLRGGIGMHHGRVPRSLAQYVVREFNAMRLSFLVCTSTLIEGVNTAARNIVIFDNKIARRRLDYFTFSNIRGRSGRMYQYVVGHVYLFHPAPDEELPFVDIPLITQTAASDSLLVQLDLKDLTPGSAERVRKFSEQDVLSLNAIRSNAGVDPEKQIAIARALSEEPELYWRQIAWDGLPTKQQVRDICRIIWDFFFVGRQRYHGVNGGAQLAAKLNIYRAFRLQGMIQREIRRRPDDADTAVEGVIEFERQWIGYELPRLIMAINNIQSDVFTRIGLPAGDYRRFASLLENFLLEPPLGALDEYGIPLQTAGRLRNMLRSDGDLDAVLDRVRRLDTETLAISDFEKALFRYAQEGLGAA